MVSTKKPGRPKKQTSEQPKKDISSIYEKEIPDLVSTIEKYLLEAKWTKEQLMAAIGIGETQLYRWGRGDSMPRKATVNRICGVLTRRLDELYGDDFDPFPATDQIDAILNELLQKAGFSASVRGTSGDECWDRIAKKKSWKLGYTSVPGWAERPTHRNGKPSGKAIEYAETIGRLMGLETEWVYLNFEQMPLAIRERELDGIAPIMIVLPGRLFDFGFSNKCGFDNFTLSALIPIELAKEAKSLDDLPTRSLELVFVSGELGDWGAKVLASRYNIDDSDKERRIQQFDKLEQAYTYIQASVTNKENKISILLIDNITAKSLEDRSNKEQGSFTLKQINCYIKLRTYNSFAFHPDEKKLIDGVNTAIDLIPLIDINNFSDNSTEDPTSVKIESMEEKLHV
jgi:transcriptional regulator with XRE-family HTH domain